LLGVGLDKLKFEFEFMLTFEFMFEFKLRLRSSKLKFVFASEFALISMFSFRYIFELSSTPLPPERSQYTEKAPNITSTVAIIVNKTTTTVFERGGAATALVGAAFDLTPCSCFSPDVEITIRSESDFEPDSVGGGGVKGVVPEPAGGFRRMIV
jgi:hypothetical protein